MDESVLLLPSLARSTQSFGTKFFINQLMRSLNVLTCFVLWSALLLIWSFILRSVWTKTSKVRSLLMKISLSVSTVIYLFLALEIIFYSSFAVSDTFGFALASQRWNEKYWHPLNSFGYRDREARSLENQRPAWF